MAISSTPFDAAYEDDTAPWIIDEPQPAIVALERDGWIHGAVLDAGCGTGEHTIHLARLSYDVVGVDFSAAAVARARSNAASRHVDARFERADALDLGDQPRFDTVVDSALFHVFDAADQAAYARSLHAVGRPGALVCVLALSDAGPGFGPQISDTAIRDAFAAPDWTIEDLRPNTYRVRVDAERSDQFDLPIGKADLPAWLARVRRRP